MEQWLDVVGFEGYYVVSNLGRIMRVARSSRGQKPGTIRNPTVTRCGYLSMTLSRNGIQITKSVHRWVAEAFLGPGPDGHEVNHINGDKADNRACNLEWLTHIENSRHSFDVLNRHRATGEECSKTKLSEEDIPVIRDLARQGMSRRKIGEMYGVSNTAITLIVNGTNWKHVK